MTELTEVKLHIYCREQIDVISTPFIFNGYVKSTPTLVNLFLELDSEKVAGVLRSGAEWSSAE